MVIIIIRNNDKYDYEEDGWKVLFHETSKYIFKIDLALVTILFQFHNYFLVQSATADFN